jgi:alpha-1,6-mannosyltransferase
MRIAQLANFYTPTSGGLRTSLEQIGRGYVHRGHERILIVPSTTDGDELTPAGRRISLASPRMPGDGDYRVLTARARVRAILDEVRPDVLEVSDKLSIAWLARWARRRGVPVVLFSHERLDAILRPRVPSWLPLPTVANLVNRRLCRLSDAIIVASTFSGEEFRRLGATNVRQIPLGVDLTVFRPASDPVLAAVVGGQQATTVTSQLRPHLVCVGRLSSEKNPELAVDTLRELRRAGLDARLTMVGDGPLRTQLERRAVGLPVVFTGYVGQPDQVAEIVAQADVALAPSGVESFGLAILEALACGTPVVVRDDGAGPELVRSEGAGAACAGTPEAMAQGVARLLELDRTLRRRAARRAAEAFPWSATVDRLLDLYRGVLLGQQRLVGARVRSSGGAVVRRLHGSRVMGGGKASRRSRGRVH